MGKTNQPKDHLGQMTDHDLSNFRTTWCAKRYDHDHELCGFAHFEVNGGWLRRNPSKQRYKAEMCTCIVAVPDNSTGKTQFSLNHCSKGINCELCHSKEELIYHPSNYKTNLCHSESCRLGDVCPNLHPRDSHHAAKKPGNDARHIGQQRHGVRQGHHHHHNNFSNGNQGRGVTSIPPPGAPMLYVNPAPFSSFDHLLHLPGLQSLFRRQSAVIRSGLGRPAATMKYSNFGNEWGNNGESDSSSSTRPRGLPSKRHERGNWIVLSKTDTSVRLFGSMNFRKRVHQCSTCYNLCQMCYWKPQCTYVNKVTLTVSVSWFAVDLRGLKPLERQSIQVS